MAQRDGARKSDAIARRGLMLVLSSPSGAGKTTLSRMLLDASERFDPDRLHQEAILIASKADVREELDRLAAHVAQATKTIRDGGAVGRRLDFVAQELNRETNTLCAKANDMELTNIGLELKSLVEQFREQVQNLE